MTGDLFQSLPPAQRPARDPREHVCRTRQGMAVFADGAAWYCPAHVPAGFLPHTRGGRA